MSTRKECLDLLRSVGRASAMKGTMVWLWISTLTDMLKRSRKRSTKTMIKTAARTLADDDELRAAFESVVRLGEGRSVAMWITQRFGPAPLTEEQRLAARLAGVQAKAKREEAHARAKLAEHETALKRERQAVKRWRAKVRYYDRKGAKNGNEQA
jgi:hypothetical protein